MSYITLKCKNCGANMSLNTESHSATCIHCGSTFLISDILDEKDIAFTEKFTPKNLEQKMMAQDALKQGETYLYKAEYEKAEGCFKRAIELDENNYKGYLGVVKAKTQNLNELPENDDYLQYAHYALSLAQADDYTIVESELSKIDLLKREKNRQKKIISANQKREEQMQQQKASITKISAVIAVFILIMFGMFLLISSVFTGAIFGDKDARKTINVDSYSTLKRVFSSDQYLNYEINLTKNIDCKNETISPLGSASKAFTGVFNGNKYTISNAIIEPEDDDDFNYMGFFGHTVLAKINNVIFDNIMLSIPYEFSSESQISCGILAGKIEATTINNVEVKNTCNILINNNLDCTLCVGGLVGYSTNSSVISSISCHATISTNLTEIIKPASVYVGGVIGLSNNSYFNKCCSNGAIYSSINNTSYSSSDGFFGGIAGFVQDSSNKNISNIKSNFFSGVINVNSSRINCKISAITGTESWIATKQENYCLFLPGNFKYNNTNLQFVNLYDYNYNEYLVEFCISNSTYISELSSTFNSWNNSTTFMPTLA